MKKDNHRRKIVLESPEGEYGEIYNIEPKRRTIGDNDVGDIEDKIIIVNPTNKNNK
ncbi:hypothetical protein QBE52_12035 [Clostridiaceae bacterium 35-E11]